MFRNPKRLSQGEAKNICMYIAKVLSLETSDFLVGVSEETFQVSEDESLNTIISMSTAAAAQRFIDAMKNKFGDFYSNKVTVVDEENSCKIIFPARVCHLIYAELNQINLINEFKRNYLEDYTQARFANPFSSMKSLVDHGYITSIHQVRNYAKKHEGSRTSIQMMNYDTINNNQVFYIEDVIIELRRRIEYFNLKANSFFGIGCKEKANRLQLALNRANDMISRFRSTQEFLNYKKDGHESINEALAYRRIGFSKTTSEDILELMQKNTR